MYKDEIKDDLMTLLNQFLNEEHGNKVTTFSMNGLVSAIQNIFNKNEIKE